MSTQVESFELDHRKVQAPFVRLAGRKTGIKGDVVIKYDVRFCQPNDQEMPAKGIHTMEHLLAKYLRELPACTGEVPFHEVLIDISPMGCRTGFYMTLWSVGGWDDIPRVCRVMNKLLERIAVAERSDVPAVNARQCGNYRLHSIIEARKIAQSVLDKGGFVPFRFKSKRS